MTSDIRNVNEGTYLTSELDDSGYPNDPGLESIEQALAYQEECEITEGELLEDGRLKLTVLLNPRMQGTQARKVVPSKMDSTPLGVDDYVMTTAEFIESVGMRALVSSDGIGRYVKDNKDTGIPARPQDVYLGRVRTEFTHVVWYNK